MDRRIALLPLLALTGTSLSGCVAVAIPAIAGSAIFRTQTDGKDAGKPKQAESRPAPAVAAVTPRPAPAPAPAPKPTVTVMPSSAQPPAAAPAPVQVAIPAPKPVTPPPAAVPVPVQVAVPAARPATPPAAAPAPAPVPVVRPAPVLAAAPAITAAPKPVTPPAAAKPASGPALTPSAPIPAAPARVIIPAPAPKPVTPPAAAPAPAPVPAQAPVPAIAAAPVIRPQPGAPSASFPDPSNPLPAEQNSFARFVRYGQASARGVAGGADLASAMLSDPVALDGKRRRCAVGEQLVALIDLDPAGGVFTPPANPAKQSSLALGLAVLRQAGVEIAWLSDLPVNQSGQVRSALEMSGLDQRGVDIISLRRDENDSKQQRKENLAGITCIVAIAGDERADFDDRFKYLRSPEAGAGLEPVIGDGWFLISSLFSEAQSAGQ